ncbi:YjfB family protein [Cohnella abietis]|uniref:Motility protein n=1 Tax=Cohnella abietis TaxID=2507935 RepID=A0A3T1D0X0_9BACL|nr:YjfB family protein [Cohnella abietis]BBI31750.1 hypothetical protein KCTCHS21_11490 [Cohnella abietis]
MSSISAVGSAATGSLKQQVGIAVLAKTLDSNEQQGQQIAQLLQQSVQPHLGSNIDIKV